jgi:glutamate-ammonia-ligase adenylyltransferase
VQALRDESKPAPGPADAAPAAWRGRRRAAAEAAALRFIDWVEPLLRRESYLALLAERPEVQRRLLRLLGMARWPMQYLMRHPGVIDELADERLLHLRFDRAGFPPTWTTATPPGSAPARPTKSPARHAAPRAPCRGVPHPGARRGRANSRSSRWPTTCRRWPTRCWTAACAGPGRACASATAPSPRFAVIAYGKLGGKELGYGSDLDVVFLYDDSDEADPDRAQEAYGAFVRKLITWLTLRTAAGELFDIDTALRPNGNSGLLVTSIDASSATSRPRQQHRLDLGAPGLTRARWCAGPPGLAARFEATRRTVLTAPRDPAALREEVRHAREGARARPVRAGRFDVKHSAGGMMDVEFAVQYLVLAHSAAHPALLDNGQHRAAAARRGVGAAACCPPAWARRAADAYRELRRGPAPAAPGRAAHPVRAWRW